jgi:hypothetical protein
MSLMTTFKDGEIDRLPFEASANKVLQTLRTSIRAVIGSVPQAGRIKRAADVQRAFTIDSKLAWQLHKLAFADKPLREASNLPKTASMKRFLRAAEAQGVDRDLIRTAEAAMDDLDRLIEVHAGNFDAFESMLSGLQGADSEATDLAHRRMAFKAQSHILGTQARTQVNCYILNASRDNPDKLDVAMIRGKINLRRFRKDASVVVASIGVSNDEGDQPDAVVREAIDEGADGAIAVMREFCSRPMPGFRSVQGSLGMTHLQLADDTVGNQSAVTHVVGDVTRAAVERYQGPHDKVQMCQALVRSPSEVLVLDVLAPAGLFADSDPRIAVFADERSGDAIAAGRDHDRLPCRETISHLGRGAEVIHSPDVPRYAEMMTYVFGRLGWDASTFDVWRCRVEYPIMPSSVVVSFDLLKSP